MRSLTRIAPLALVLAAGSVAAQAVPADSAPAPLRIDFADPVNGLSGPILLVLRQKGVPAPRGTFVMLTDSGPANPRAQFVRSNVPDSVVPLLNQVVANHLAAQRSMAPVRLSFRMDAAANAEILRPGKPVRPTTEPELRNRTEIRRLGQQILRLHPRVEDLQRADARVRLRVDSEGRVVFVILDRPTGDADIDLYLMSLMYELRFHPGRAGGMPVNAWVALTLSFQGGAARG